MSGARTLQSFLELAQGHDRLVVPSELLQANQAEQWAHSIRDKLAAAQAEIAPLREELGIREGHRAWASTPSTTWWQVRANCG